MIHSHVSTLTHTHACILYARTRHTHTRTHTHTHTHTQARTHQRDVLDHMGNSDFRVLLKHAGHQAVAADVVYALRGRETVKRH